MMHGEARARRAEIAARVKAGLGMGQAAKHFGVSMNTVRSACHENEVLTSRKRIPKSFEILAELQNGDCTQAEVARRLGTSRQLVSWTARQARAAGIPIPDRASEE